MRMNRLFPKRGTLPLAFLTVVALPRSGLAVQTDFHLDYQTLPQVELTRPACQSGDDECPWWVYGNAFGQAKELTMGVVFRTVSHGPISSRMHCFHAGCLDARSMFPDASDNFNATGDYYCAAVGHGGFTQSQICDQVAPGAYRLNLDTWVPFEPGEVLAAGFKTGGDRSRDSYLKVYDIRLIYEGPSPGYFGADTNVNPLRFPMGEENGFDFYAGRLGSGRSKCRIHQNGWDVLRLPKLRPVPDGKKCQFDFEVVEHMRDELGREAARRRTYAYWLLQGPKYHRKNPKKWGKKQARKLYRQVDRYREWIDGRTLFADIEPPLHGTSGDTWEICVKPSTGGSVTYPEACARNRAVLEGFLQFVVRLQALSEKFDEPSVFFEPGVYTRPEAWVTYFGVEWVPEAKFGLGRRRTKGHAAFVLWLAGCASSDGLYAAGEPRAEAQEILRRQMLPILRETTLGGSRTVLWQYHLEKPDFDATLHDPAGGFTPAPSSVPYYCSCDDPGLWRFGSVGSCPALEHVLLETLSVPADGTVLTTSRTYPSHKVFRIEVSGMFQWSSCSPAACPLGEACDYAKWSDAEYLTEDCWLSHEDDSAGQDRSLFLDGENVQWGGYRPDHVYSHLVSGRDGPLSFHIEDCVTCYEDNEGSLIVRIYEITP